MLTEAFIGTVSTPPSNWARRSATVAIPTAITDAVRWATRTAAVKTIAKGTVDTAAFLSAVRTKQCRRASWKTTKKEKLSR